MADNSAIKQGTPATEIKRHVGEQILSQNTRPALKTAKSAQEILADNNDKSLWEWVEVPDTDLFGEIHTGVSINFEKFLPGKHFVSPEMASEIKRLLELRLRGDMRVLQPKQDVVMARIMQKSQLGAPTNPGLKGLNDA